MRSGKCPFAQSPGDGSLGVLEYLNRWWMTADPDTVFARTDLLQTAEQSREDGTSPLVYF